MHPAEIPRLTKVAPQQPQVAHRDAEAIWRHYGMSQPHGRNEWNVATRTEADYYPTMRVHQATAPEAMTAGSIKAPPTGAAPERTRRRRSSSRSRRSGGGGKSRRSSSRRRRSSSPQAFSPRADTYAKIPAQSYASRK